MDVPNPELDAQDGRRALKPFPSTCCPGSADQERAARAGVPLAGQGLHPALPGWAVAANPGSTRAEGACGCSFLSTALETCCNFNNQLQQNWAGPASLSTTPLATEHGLDNLRHMAGPRGDGPCGQGSAGSVLVLVVDKEQLAQDPCSLQMNPQTTSSEICNFGAAQVRSALLKFMELHHTPQILVCPEAFSYKEE